MGIMANQSAALILVLATLSFAQGALGSPQCAGLFAGDTSVFPISFDVAVRGSQTRTYKVDGRVAYVAFDQQKVSLLELDPGTNLFSVIPGQGTSQHPQGFSTPVGKVKDLGHLRDYSIEDLRVKLGAEGSVVKIEFESGVVVTGEIEKYTPSLVSKNLNPVVISFKTGTCRVKLGDVTLFAPSWGSYDMLLN